MQSRYKRKYRLPSNSTVGHPHNRPRAPHLQSSTKQRRQCKRSLSNTKMAKTSPKLPQPKSHDPNITITSWPVDTELPLEAKTALVGGSTLFYRSMFGDAIPPKGHFLGEISFPFTLLRPMPNNTSSNSVGKNNTQSHPTFSTLSQVLCESLLHNNYLNQSTFDSLSRSPQQQQQSLLPTSISHSKKSGPSASSPPQPETATITGLVYNIDRSIGSLQPKIHPNTPLADDILSFYKHNSFDPHNNNTHHSDTHSTHEQTLIVSGNGLQQHSQSIRPLPAYLVQGSYHNIKTFTSALKSHLNQHYSLTPALLAKLFNIPLSVLKGNDPLVEFLQARHVSLLSSFLLGRLLIAVDSHYSPIHIIDLPHFANNTIASQQQELAHQSLINGPTHVGSTNNHSNQNNNNNHHLHHSPLSLDISDIIANVIEKQSPITIPLTHLPRQRYGGPRQDYNNLRATKSLTAIKLHHGFAEPPKPHPSDPVRTIKTLAPLPTTLQHTQLGYILPLPLFSSIMASQSSTTFSIPAAVSVIADHFDTRLNPAYLRAYNLDHSQQQQHRVLYGNFNNFVPTRIDYLTLFQSHFAKWSHNWLTSRSRLPQLNILDMGCGTGVLSVTAQDIFHHLATLHGDMYSEGKLSPLTTDPFGDLSPTTTTSFPARTIPTTTTRLDTYLRAKRPQPFKLAITSADISPRAVSTTQKNHELLNHYHEKEPHGGYVHGQLYHGDEIDDMTVNNTLAAERLYRKTSDEIERLKMKRGSQYQYGITTQVVQSDLFELLPHPEPKPALLDQLPTSLSSSSSSPMMTVTSTKPYYDLIIFNPPWLPIPQRSIGSSDRAIFDNQFQTLTSFLHQARSHLRSAQPFYRHLYRRVKHGELGMPMLPTGGGGSSGGKNKDQGAACLNDHSLLGRTDELDDNCNDAEHFDPSSNLFKHKHIYETNTSEVWIIISDLFQQLGLDQGLLPKLNQKRNDGSCGGDDENNPLDIAIQPVSSHFHQKFPAQSRFITYLEQNSGLSLTDLVDTQSHNFDQMINSSKGPKLSQSDLAAIRSRERVMLYVLRDLRF